MIALVLARNGEPWLRRTLDGLVAQRRPADVIIGISSHSSDASAELLAEAMSVTVELEPRDLRHEAGQRGGIADALAAGVAAAHRARALRVSAGGTGQPEVTAADGDAPAPIGSDSDDDTIAWYWILHDDSAPEVDCLSSLLKGADRNPKAAVLVPKTVAWSDSGRLVGVGTLWTPGAPVVDPLDVHEHDQGQHDVDRAVYAGDSAGMLVRADVWQALAGLDPEIGDWAGPTDLCRRVWGSGAEVFFIPGAVLAHRRAGHRGVRLDGDSVSRPRREARAGQLRLELSQSPAWALPWRTVRAWLSTAVRMVALLVTREPEEATAEAAGAWQVLGHPRRMLRARRRARRAPVTDLSRPAHVRARRGAAITNSLERQLSASSGSIVRIWWPPPARFWHPLALVGVLAVAAFTRDPGQFVGSGTLRGGGLLPAPGATELLVDYLDSWRDARFGTGAPMPAYLPLLSAASVVTLGSVDQLLRLAFGLAVPLAFLSCYVSVRSWLDGPNRFLAALAYGLLPAGAAAMGGGRISTLAVLLLAPPTARLVVVAFTRASAGVPGVRAALAAGTMLGVVCAFAPSAFVVAVGAALVSWAGLRLARWPVQTGLIIIGVAAAFLVLWAPRVLSAPWLMLSEAGVNDPSLGMPQARVWGLSPGGPTSVDWAGLPLTITAGVAVIVARFSARAFVLLAGSATLLVASAWWSTLPSRWWPDLAVGMLWPGVPLLLAGGLLVILVADTATQSGLGGRVLSWVWAACVAALAVGWWMAPAMLTVSSDSGVPPVVGLAADSSARPRALVLDRADGTLRYAVETGPQTVLGDADALAGQPVDPGFADAVAGLVSGASGAVERELGGRAIRFVVFDGPPEDPVVGELDATVGLRQLARAPEQSLWLVTGEPRRVELGAVEGADAGWAADPIEVPVRTTPTSVQVVLHPEMDLPRRLVVAERSDPGWRATVAGVELDLVTDAQGMSQATVTIPGDLTVTHHSAWPYLAVAQLVLIAALVVLSLPKRRPVDPDASGDDR